MIYELRIYYMHKGRMDAIKDRFAKGTLNIFPKHGIKVVDFWLDAEGKDALYYTCEFESVEAMKQAWASFVADPVWIKLKEESEASGPIVDHIESFTMERAPFWRGCCCS